VFISLFLECQYIQIEIVINKYKIVHTGPNTQSGGLKTGLFNKEYQGSLKVTVANPPINEAENVMIRNNINVTILFFNIMFIHNKK
tara:strand:- start:69 stop:326 length:258 start_codon:yes stop_codon:yes gene_type:complete